MRPGVWGKKIGMTQIFSGDRAVPVTAIDLAGWYITAVKTVDRDGYTAIQVARPRDRYLDREEFDIMSWMKKPRTFFAAIREVGVSPDVDLLTNYVLGKPFDPSQVVVAGQLVHVAGVTKGAGFAGVVRRHGFAGAPASHGATMGKRPGSIGSFTACGKVIKGKAMPGHMGAKRRLSQNLEVVSLDLEALVVLVKGSVPGKAGSFVHVQAA